MLRSRKKLQTKRVKTRIGSLYLGMDTDTMSKILYTSVFIARRIAFATFTVVLSEKHPLGTIFSFIYLNLAYLTYIAAVMPHLTILGFLHEFFNECTL